MDEEYYSYIKKLFGSWARVYDIWTLFVSGVRDKVVDFTNAREGSRILDICTGTGRQAFAFGKRGYNVIGVDLSEDMLRVANKNNKYENVKFKIADAIDMPFENNHFDVSCVSFGLHDMPLTIREKVLNEMIRVTKPEGVMVIVDYTLPRNKIARFMTYYFVRSYESKYYPEFIKSDFEGMLKKLGIEIKGEVSVLGGVGKILKGIKWSIKS